LFTVLHPEVRRKRKDAAGDQSHAEVTPEDDPEGLPSTAQRD
jgi:hypothetical protein